MKNSKILPIGFAAVMVVLSGLTVATAQTAPQAAPVKAETALQDGKVTRADFRKGHGDRGGRNGGMMRQMMQKVDADGDRAITQAEIDTFRSGLVSGADVSGEGDISLDEFQTIYMDMMRNKMVDAFQRLDEDGDGAVTQAEMDQRFGNIVERMDRNDDGKLDRDDHGKRHGKQHGRGDRDHGNKRQGDRS